MNLGKVMAGVAAVSLMAAPIAVEAGTKASAVAMPAHAATNVDAKHKGVGGGFLIGGLALAAVIGGIVALSTGGKHHCDSPGAC